MKQNLSPIITGTLLNTGALLKVANPQLKPNVVLIIVDDLGSGDVSCLFCQVVKTPNKFTVSG